MALASHRQMDTLRGTLGSPEPKHSMSISHRACHHRLTSSQEPTFRDLPEARKSNTTSNSATASAMFDEAGALSLSNNSGTRRLPHAVMRGPGSTVGRDSIRRICSPACRNWMFPYNIGQIERSTPFARLPTAVVLTLGLSDLAEAAMTRQARSR